MKIQVIVDEPLKKQLTREANSSGLSMSACVRDLIKKALTTKSLNQHRPNEVDLSLEDIKKGRVETLTLAQFKKQIKNLG